MQISQVISVFHGRKAPEQATLVGYGAVIAAYGLAVPMPQRLALVSDKRRSYITDQWTVFSSRNSFEDTLYKHLVFALKYEGVNLLVLKALFVKLTEQEVLALLTTEPTGQYSRRMWFLYEWLLDTLLPLPDLAMKKAVPLLDEGFHYTVKGISSPRHRIINNLPGTRDFCPLIRRTGKLDAYISADLSSKSSTYLKGVHRELLQRTSAFLLLKDSRASFNIEGESPRSARAVRWGQAIGQAGGRRLDKEELLRLQQLVIENDRFIKMGFREQGGFVGEHDRSTGEPIPDHISARPEDVMLLLDGLIETTALLEESDMDAVLAAAAIAFGFVFIHPFVDGNGRIHRYLIHHVLARKGLSQQGIIFPVSAAILDRIADYGALLEKYSHPLLDLIEWRTTPDNNVEVLNETIDLYRYFDATEQAEFLYDCVNDTIEHIIPAEVRYLRCFDEFKRYLDDSFDMPNKTVALLVRFLEQGEGKLSKRAREKEFAPLSDAEVATIEHEFRSVFMDSVRMGRRDVQSD